MVRRNETKHNFKAEWECQEKVLWSFQCCAEPADGYEGDWMAKIECDLERSVCKVRLDPYGFRG